MTLIDEYIMFASRTFKERPLRTSLTMIGIFIGIAAVVALISIGQGFQNYIDGAFEDIGTDKVFIQPGFSAFQIGGVASSLTEKDLDAIKKVRGVTKADGMQFTLARVKLDEEIESRFVIGIPTDDEGFGLVMESVGIEEGRQFKDSDTNSVLVGWILANDNPSGKNIKLRQTIEIEGIKFKVVGTLERIGNQQDDSQVYIPFEVSNDLFEKSNEYDWIIAKVQKGEEPAVVQERIDKKLRSTRSVKEDEEDFITSTAEDLLITFNAVFGLVQVILIGLAAVSLLVGGIGIMNTMYTAVLDRTNEIGVMKAIGAQNKDIFSIFIIESGLLGLMGGIIGVIIGYSIAKFVGSIAEASGYTLLISFQPSLIIGALLFAFVVGSLSGFIPAYQASKLQPVDTLRYE